MREDPRYAMPLTSNGGTIGLIGGLRDLVVRAGLLRTIVATIATLENPLIYNVL